MTSWLKQSVQIDDSLDVFAVHGIGGIMGTLGVSFLAAPVFQGLGLADGLGIGQQLWVQTIGVLSIATWSAVASFVIIKLADLIFGLRVSEEDEIEGLDFTAHGETGYDL